MTLAFDLFLSRFHLSLDLGLKFCDDDSLNPRLYLNVQEIETIIYGAFTIC